MCPDKDSSARPRQPAVVRAYLELVRNRELLDAILLDLFKHHPACKGRGLSLPKYNVLRILRGASREGGLPCQEPRKCSSDRIFQSGEIAEGVYFPRNSQIIDQVCCILLSRT